MPTYTFRFPASLPSLPVTVYPLTGGVRGASAATGTTGSDATFTTTLAAGDYLAVVQYRGTETGVRESLAGGLADNAVTVDALNDPASDASAVLKAAFASKASQALTPGPILGGYQVQQVTSNGTDTGVNSMAKYTVPATVEVDVLRLRFSNTQCGSNGDLDAPNAIPLTASVGPTATGPWFPVRLAGSKTMTLDAGAHIETDPMWMRVTAGGTFYVKTFVSVTAGNKWPAQINPGNKGTDFWVQHSASETDLTLSTAAFTPVTGSQPFLPVAVVADQPPTQARVALIGDSIVGGTGDTAISLGGFVYRALTGVLPYSRISVSGSRVQNIADPNVGRRRMVLIRGANTALIMYGTNDIFTALRTLAQVQADHISLWTALATMGIKPTECTLVPQTTSTDSWATTANQTTKTGETVRAGFNDWLRDGAPMLSGAAVAVGSNAAGTVRAGQSGHNLAGYFETADVVESARNSGLWKANLTADGTHPTSAAHTSLAAVITPATFTALASI